MRNFLKALSRFLLRDYSFYRIYGRHCMDNDTSPMAEFRFEPIEKNQISDSLDAMIAEQAGTTTGIPMLTPAWRIPVLSAFVSSGMEPVIPGGISGRLGNTKPSWCRYSSSRKNEEGESGIAS